MGSFRVFNQRNGRLATLAALTVATLAQGLVPALVSADQVTDRSVELSSSSAKATGVTYKVNFTAGTKDAAGAFVVQFCSDTPLIGQSCAAPDGMNASGATTSTSGASISTTTAATANKVVVDDTIAKSATVSVELGNITNPTDAGTIYARIVTYEADGDASGYNSDGTSLGSNTVDQGSVAVSITDSMGVTGDVLETMQFCIAGGDTAIAANCNDGGALTSPALTLGEKSGEVTALTSTALSTANIQTQMSTNASGGAVVYLKSSTAGCGGLAMSGTGDCNIKPWTTTGSSFDAGQAFFGVKTGTDVVDGGTGNNETYEHAGSYGSTNYFMNYVTGDATGVTSTYGDPILTTNGTQINGQNMQLTFGASIAPNTPAGRYSADLSLIATGTF